MDDAKIEFLLFPAYMCSYDNDEWDWNEFGSSWGRFFTTLVRFYAQEEGEIPQKEKLELELAYREMLEDFFNSSYLEGKRNREMHFELPGAKELLGRASQIVIEQLLVSYDRKDPRGLADNFKRTFNSLDDWDYEEVLKTAQACVNNLRQELQSSKAPFVEMILSHFDDNV